MHALSKLTFGGVILACLLLEPTWRAGNCATHESGGGWVFRPQTVSGIPGLRLVLAEAGVAYELENDGAMH